VSPHLSHQVHTPCIHPPAMSTPPSLLLRRDSPLPSPVFPTPHKDFAAGSDKKSSANSNKNSTTTGKPQNVVLVICSVTDKYPIWLVESYDLRI
jgi:hypothetical protein